MQQVWKQTVMGVIWALVLMMAGSILMSISAMVAVAGALFGSSGAAGGFGFLTIVCLLAMIGGFVWFFINLSKFITIQQTDADRSAISNVRTSYIIFIVGAILNFIPVIGWIVNLICALVANILLIIAFNNFSNSQFMNPTGRSGASLLKVQAIITLICAILMIIPVVNILAIIGEIVALVLLFVGWSKVSNGHGEVVL
ncbi:MAG: hypothetical protein J1F20_07810 [Muribaculaceae bacterium]|nr:hypothetical protein [Muribaculaceae bacterium]